MLCWISSQTKLTKSQAQNVYTSRVMRKEKFDHLKCKQVGSSNFFTRIVDNDETCLTHSNTDNKNSSLEYLVVAAQKLLSNILYAATAQIPHNYVRFGSVNGAELAPGQKTCM